MKLELSLTTAGLCSSYFKAKFMKSGKFAEGKIKVINLKLIQINSKLAWNRFYKLLKCIFEEAIFLLIKFWLDN